jgi:hypothetical protein
MPENIPAITGISPVGDSIQVAMIKPLRRPEKTSDVEGHRLA